MRKLWFAHTACALVAFPGGFGLDEMFEILTLQQTAKLDRTIVMLLYGSDYWRESSTSTPWFVTARSVVSPFVWKFEDGAFSRVLNNPGTTPDCTGGMRPWRNVPGT